MRLFIKETEADGTGNTVKCWKPHTLVMNYSTQEVHISYHGYASLSFLQMGKKVVANTVIEFTIKNWSETILSTDNTESVVEHNDFTTFVKDGLDAEVDSALIRHIQTVDENAIFRDAQVIDILGNNF